MEFFPIFLDIRSKRCLVVGGGAVAERKTANLLKAGADLILIAPKITNSLKSWKDAGQLTQLEREFNEADISGSRLVIAATDSRYASVISEDAVYRFMPAVIGDEDLAGFHGTNERMSVDNLARMIRGYAQLMMVLCGPA